MQEPLTLRAARVAFGGVGAVLPEPMAALAERMYFTPRRHRTPERERVLLEDATPFTLATSAGPLHAWRWEPVLPWERGARGTVLLVHGWEGRASQLAAFVPPLVAQGFTVVGADAPGHGRSPGAAPDAIVYAELLGDVARAVGDVRAVLAHSFGCAATTLALEGGALAPDVAVLVSAPCALERYVDTFARTVGLTRATEAIFRARLEQRFGKDWTRRYALDARASSIEVPTLFVHDTDDVEALYVEGDRLARAWPGATMHATHGLGHRRILRDDDVIARVASFVGDGVAR